MFRPVFHHTPDPHDHNDPVHAGFFDQRDAPRARDYQARAFTVGIGGPVGSGKTALLLALCRRLRDRHQLGVVTNDIFTREDAELALRSVRYPPNGMRGVGLARAQGYGLDIEAYQKWNEANSVVIVQIEHVRAIENLEAIFATGVDAFMVGPYDLSASMGIPGQFEQDRFREVLQEVRKIALKTSKPAGARVIC